MPVPTREEILEVLTMTGVGETIQPYWIIHLFIKRINQDLFEAGPLRINGEIIPSGYVYSSQALVLEIQRIYKILHPGEDKS
jgi:hypothetical protein